MTVLSLILGAFTTSYLGGIVFKMAFDFSIVVLSVLSKDDRFFEKGFDVCCVVLFYFKDIKKTFLGKYLNSQFVTAV